MRKPQSYLKDNPDLLKQLHPSKNEDIEIKKIPKCTNKKLWWICDKGHEWQASPNDRQRGRGCPFCSGRVSDETNNLAVARPDLAAEWNPKNTTSPLEYCPSSGKKVWWICGKKHEWEATIDHRNRGRGCPFCKKRKASPENNLAKLHPELAKQWHPTKNKMKANEVSPSCTKTVFWICRNGHEFTSTVVLRTHSKCFHQNCRKCRTLEFMYPDIAKQWHPTLNTLKPSDVTYGDPKKVYWQCSKNQNHVWLANISSRTCAKKYGCPLCRESKGELKIAKILDQLGISYSRQFKFDNCKNQKKLSFDFAIFPPGKPMAIIEFNGEQHYRVVPYWGGKDKFENVQKIDFIKKEYCNKNNIPFLVVHYLKIDKMENEIFNFIKQM